MENITNFFSLGSCDSRTHALCTAAYHAHNNAVASRETMACTLSDITAVPLPHAAPLISTINLVCFWETTTRKTFLLLQWVWTMISYLSYYKGMAVATQQCCRDDWPLFYFHSFPVTKNTTIYKKITNHCDKNVHGRPVTFVWLLITILDQDVVSISGCMRTLLKTTMIEYYSVTMYILWTFLHC